jgi:hypothetical protein
MDGDESIVNAGLDQLLLDSTFAGIDEDAPPSQIETVLRSLAGMIANADPLRRAIVRDTVIRRLRRAGVSCPVTLANVALGPQRPAKVETISTNQLFPHLEPWSEPVHGALLLEDMVSLLRRFIVLSPAATDAEALWCVHTYVHDAAAVSPNLCLSSPEKRCGKTRNLQILGCLVQRPLHTANVTTAALTRAIHQYRPTLLIDEADTIFTNGGSAELRGILNAGLYRSTAFILRCGGHRQQPQARSVWCPKAIALIGRLPTTLEDRSITILMRRRRPDDRVEVFEYEKVYAGVEHVRRRAARWALDHADRLGNTMVAPPDALHDRARDLWSPLLAIADEVGGGWPQRARSAALELARVPSDDGSFAIQLLGWIQALFKARHADRLPSQTVVDALADHEDSPWRDDLPLTKAQLARQLAPFGIRPMIVHRSRSHVHRGYLLREFHDAFRRYLPK